MTWRQFLLFIYSTVAVISGPISSMGSDKSCHRVLNEPVFQSFDKYQTLYRPNVCCDNIFYLLQEIKNAHPDFDLSQVDVLYIYSRWTKGTSYLHGFNYFLPLLSRQHRPSPWGFHTILKYQDTIYDFDYSSEPVAVPVVDYFKTMFGAYWFEATGQWHYEETQQNCLDCEIDLPRDAQLRFHIRSIPGAVYLDEYLPVRNRNGIAGGRTKSFKHWTTTEGEYQDRLLRDFLREQVSSF